MKEITKQNQIEFEARIFVASPIDQEMQMNEANEKKEQKKKVDENSESLIKVY